MTKDTWVKSTEKNINSVRAAIDKNAIMPFFDRINEMMIAARPSNCPTVKLENVNTYLEWPKNVAMMPFELFIERFQKPKSSWRPYAVAADNDESVAMHRSMTDMLKRSALIVNKETARILLSVVKTYCERPNLHRIYFERMPTVHFAPIAPLLTDKDMNEKKVAAVAANLKQSYEKHADGNVDRMWEFVTYVKHRDKLEKYKGQSYYMPGGISYEKPTFDKAANYVWDAKRPQISLDKYAEDLRAAGKRAQRKIEDFWKVCFSRQ